MSAEQISSHFESHLSFIQKYLLSSDKQDFLKNVTNNSDKKILELLTSPLPEKHEQLFNQLRIPQNLRKQILNVKLMTQLRSQNNQQKKNKIIEKIIKEFYNNINFQYSKPIETISYQSEQIEQKIEEGQDKDSKLILQQSLKKYLQNQIEKDSNKFRNLTDYGIKQLDTAFLQKLSLDSRRYLISKIHLLKTFDDQFVVKFVLQTSRLQGQIRGLLPEDQISSTVINALSLSQINLMLKENKNIMRNSNFVKKWFQLNYLPKIQTKSGIYKKKKVTLTQMQNRRKLLVEMRQQLQKISENMLKPYVKHIFFQILALDLKRQDPSKQLFFQYLQNLQSVSYLLNQNIRQKINQQFGNKATNYNVLNCNDLVSRMYTFDSIIPAYLGKLFKKYKNHDDLIKQLGKYFEFPIINKIFAAHKLLEGQQLSNLHEILPKHEIQSLKNSKQITILEQKTQSFFKADDDVVLTLKIKNIKQLKMKIYEMDLQQYYLENINRQIDEKINLIYLNPSVQQIVQIKGIKSPYQTIEQDLLLDKIQKKYGFYIVELQGQGLTSRAGIKKGAIVCLQQNNIDGKLLKFYDQSGEMIKNLNIWIKGRQQTITDGQYLIPFSKKNQSFTIIAVKDKYAEKILVNLTTQSYSFNVGLIYNHESFIVGKKAKLILHPILKLGDENISLSNMKNIKITANLLNNLDIKSSIKIQNIKFNDENDYILQIPIKSYTKSIDIVVQGQVKDIQENIINLSYNKLIKIDLIEGTNNVLDFYLKRNNNGSSNILKVTGLNGQSFSGLQIDANLYFYGIDNVQNKVLKTNQNGQINLGALKYISKIKVSANSTQGTFSRTWMFGQQCQQAAYLRKHLTYSKEQSINIPLPFNWQVTKQNLNKFITFSKTNINNKICYQNNINSIKLKQVNGMRYLIIQNLEPALYELKFLKFDIINTINILQGKKWRNGQIFNQQTGVIYKLKPNPFHFITLGECKQVNQDQKSKKILIPVHIPQSLTQKQDLSSLRVHVQLKNYHDSIDPSLIECFNVQNKNQITHFETFNLSYKKSFFFSNKTLSDQQAYVLNRQNQKQFIGNNLQKPRIFLKRIQVRQTSQNQQQLTAEGSYANKEMDDCYFGAPAGGYNAKMCRMSNQNQKYCVGGYNQYYCVQYGLNSHNNYLQVSGNSTFNLKYNNTIQITVPKNYSQVLVNLFTEQTAIRKTYYLEDKQNSNKKDLRHAGLPQGNQKNGWSMSRQVYPLQKGQKKQISRDSMWCTVSLSNILQFASIKGHKIPDWVTQWNSYNQIKKLQVYDKQICHQLNVFIYYKDNQFFIKYLKTFIQNKITKTFVDLFLINDNSCLEYASTHKMKNLNEFEKILLIQRMIQNNMKNQAVQLANSMQLYQKSIKRTFENYKQLFDVIINSQVDSTKQKINKTIQNNKIMTSSIPPPPQAAFGYSMSNRAMAPQMMMMDMMAMEQQEQCSYNQAMDDAPMMEQRKARNNKRGSRGLRVQGARQLKAGFKQVQNTKQYTQTTYSKIKNPKQSQNLVQPNLFWAKLATYLTSNRQNKQFITDSFIYFTTPLQFTLASCFLPIELNADFELNNSGDNFIIQANSSFLIFVKQVKQLDYNDKFGVLINQRFFNPQERFTYEDDGTQIQKTVHQFLIKKPYSLQTVITNTSGTTLQLQILMDIPSGSIPLQSHEYVQITNATINAYSTVSFQRSFYFPSEGQYMIYPANASRNNIVIAKAKNLQKLIVKTKPSVNKLQTFNDVMRSGSKKQILQYIQKRNIYDPNIFSSYSILWMLNDKDFFSQVINILRKRNYFDNMIWSFGILHNERKTILEYIEHNRNQGLRSLDIPIFEYFPYYSTRTHKFLNQNKSTIRNVQFKQTYRNFLISILLQNKYTSSQKIAFAYYLMLQDRIDQSAMIFKTLTCEQRQSHKIQADYLDCYLSMYQDYPNFTIAQKISTQYKDYPIQSWRKLFKQVYDTLQQYKNDKQFQEDQKKLTSVQYKTTVLNQGKQIRLSIPPQTKVQTYFYDINLQLYFSDYPFGEIQSLSVVKPKLVKTFVSGQSREERIKIQQIQHLSNIIVEVFQFKQGVTPAKITSFFWANPKIKVKTLQNSGSLQVFCQGKKQSGCYVKVYSNGTKGPKFYRDGYTDITGTFKYALNDLDGINKFSILAITKQGGIITQVNPPEKSSFY